ncbi:hypothetical protein WKI68_38755 [Streptomyces sp. MS1.HAVA.3]|uniref:Uncharacterized protein n=1 Tax=Streptomyces caledonius TaxID=3134107 RepID=A0ABU8UCE1_9ACTN
MYEHECGPGGLSHHELRQAALAAGVIEPARLGNVDLEIGIATGGCLGRAEHPGPGYRRLRRAELSARCGDPLVPAGQYPSTGVSPPRSRTAAGPSASGRPPREASTARHGTGSSTFSWATPPTGLTPAASPTTTR